MAHITFRFSILYKASHVYFKDTVGWNFALLQLREREEVRESKREQEREREKKEERERERERNEIKIRI